MLSYKFFYTSLMLIALDSSLALADSDKDNPSFVATNSEKHHKSRSKKLSKEESILDHETAFEIATKQGFFATWTKAELKGDEWHFHGFSKSASAPMYFVVDAKTGKVIYKNENSSTIKVPAVYLNAPTTKLLEKEPGSVPPVWKIQP